MHYSCESSIHTRYPDAYNNNTERFPTHEDGWITVAGEVYWAYKDGEAQGDSTRYRHDEWQIQRWIPS
jgi:hypothetical protein